MNGMDILILLVIVLSALVLRLLVPRKKAEAAHASFDPAETEIFREARHYAYFPQIRRALSASDREYLSRNAPPRVAKQALRERRAVALGFLRGLRDDFSSLETLGRTVAALSPEVSQRQEAQRAMLSAKFQALYALVWLRLSIGMLPLDQLEVLAGLVGSLAARMDEAMAEISALSAGQMVDKLNA